jgi:two-component system phosphate regulon sensor histidine kinase PhoR
MLEEDDNPDLKRFKRYGKIIKDQSTHLVGQIDRVLHDSSRGIKPFKPQKEIINLNELIVDVTEQFRPRIINCKGNISLVLPPDDVKINADRQQLQQLLFNLLDNSVKYSKACPEIAISLDYSNGNGILSIADKGIGIPKKYQDSIFKRFFRVPHGNIHDVKGFGLGLHFVSQVVRAHKWRIKLTSEEDNGAKIEIHIR